MFVNIDDSWNDKLKEEFSKPYFNVLTNFIREEYKTKETFPPAKLIFNAFWI